MDIIFAKYVIITSTKLLAAVQRNNRTISFEPILEPMSERMAGIHKKEHLDTLLSKETPDGQNLMTRTLIAMHPLIQGDGLDAMNRRMISYLKSSITDLETQKESIDIYSWIRNSVTVATTDAIYGSRNPYRDPNVESGIWDWEQGLMYLMANVLPQYTAKQGYYGRQRVIEGFAEYFKIKPTAENSSSLMELRWNNYMEDNNIGFDTMCRVEGALAFGLVVNSVPTTFWNIFEIYSRPELLQELRLEIRNNAIHVEEQGEKKVHIVDLADIRRKCPHLVSTFQETLRLRMKGSLVRMVIKDTLLDDQTLLKKGSLLQITAGHFNQSIEHWGPDALKFNSRRFMELKNISKARQGFLAFGTAPNTCPGRQFASGEILSLVAMLILRFDIEPASSKWIEPEVNTTSLSAAVMPPQGEFMTKIYPRKEYNGCEWDFRVAGKGNFGLIIG